ncbi:MAG: gliding motility-associated C-terminal domain-containing protein [Lewinellaceae bacterium]|nr:gliding motility-associated C-terminal domain-containing protein [Lewinellaceae bacterium]
MKSTFYTVKVTNDQGCSGTDSLLLTVLPRLDVYAPNVFLQSFSNNTENNAFTIFTSKSAVLVKRLDVYNRWGELVFQKKEQLPAAEALRWDGTDLQGRLLADGVFVWLAEVTFTDGQTRVYSGDVTLLTGN